MTNIDKKIFITASILGALSVAFGAFGAHGLKQLIDTQALTTFETGVRYQMYHSLALFIPALTNKLSVSSKKWVFRFFLFGILFFSCSIYLLALKSILPFNSTSIGFITPIGGLLFVIGWIRMGYGFLLTAVD